MKILLWFPGNAVPLILKNFSQSRKIKSFDAQQEIRHSGILRKIDSTLACSNVERPEVF